MSINIISKDTVIFGNFVTRSSVEVFGKIKQPVNQEKQPAIASNGHIFIAKNASIEGDVKANDIVIEGKLQGNIIADGNVTLINGCEVNGDIECSGLVIDEGVAFKGRVISKLTQRQKKPSFLDKTKLFVTGSLAKFKTTYRV